MRPIKVGISACLLGNEVRYDGGHKRDTFLADTFGRFVEWVPVCPEVECGLGTPREAMRLVRVGNDVRMITVKTRTDLTTRMEKFARRRLPSLVQEGLSGYIFKKDSPSCGLERVKVYDAGAPTRSGRGLFAAALVERLPHLPVEEEGRLSDARLRENFVERVFAYWRLRALFDSTWTVKALVRFHTAHKLIVLAHSPEAYRYLGRLTAEAAGRPRAEVARRYEERFMKALAVIATPRRHTNVLQHMLGYFKGRLGRESKAELAAALCRFHLIAKWR
jgi:uncharacterized protein YbbK (DUF523 family)/uncharacterized protein YbgA (DUF1722 family)